MATPPPEKKQKTEEEGENDVAMVETAAPEENEESPMEAPKEEELGSIPEPPSAPELPKELETDSPDDKSARIKDAVAFLTPDTTLNLLPSTAGNVLMSLSEGGFQYFLAGARGNVGVKSGRYMFEVKILQYVDPAEDTRPGHGRRPTPKQLMKVGFSTAGSSLLLGDGDGNVSFDSEGSCVKNKTVNKVCQRFGRDTVAGVLLNLDETSANYNTVSLFLDGVRACPPQALPEGLKGKVLFPTVSFRNVTVHVNFGPEPIEPLPFKCRMLQDANLKDAAVTKFEVPKDGKFEVLFPVCLPDEGSFDWLDSFLEKNPHFMELSDRSILRMAEKSGIWRPKGYTLTSMDKPGWEFGIPLLDDFSVRTILKQVAPIQPRNFVVMEVKGNLIKEDRTALLPLWNSPSFKPIAQIVIGDPTEDFKKKSREKILKDKQMASDNMWRAQKLEEKRKKLIEKQQKDAEKARKKAEKEERKRQREMKKQAELERKNAEEQQKAEEAAKAGDAAKASEDVPMAPEAKEGEEKKESTEEVKPESETKAEGAEEAEKNSEEKMEEKAKEAEDAKMEEKEKEEDIESEEEAEEEDAMEEEDDEEEDPPKVELDEEERKAWFYKGIPDLTPYMLNTTFAKFTLPEKEEGFHDIRYSWASAPKAAEYLKAYKMEKKITMRMEDLTPSEWFHEKHRSYQRVVQAWHARHNEWKAAVAKRIADKQARRKVEAEARSKADVEAKALGPQDAQDSTEDKKDDSAETQSDAAKKTEEETKPMEVDEKKEEEGEAEEKDEEGEEDDDVDFDGLDVFDVDDVCDISKGLPLFKEFGFEDWAMTTLRFELYLLVQAFRKDCGDPERAGIHLDHLSFYYNKYYKKQLGARYYGVEDYKGLINLVKDSVYLTKQMVLDTQLPQNLESYSIFIKLAEEARRYRNLRLDLGEEDARLRVTQVPHDNDSKGRYHHFADRKGHKRDYKGDGKKGYDKGKHVPSHYQSGGHVVPYSTPPPPTYKGSDKGHHKSYDRNLPPPPPTYVPGYTPPPPPIGKDKDGKGRDGKHRDGKGKYTDRPPPPPPYEHKGGHFDSKGAPKGGHYEDRGAPKGHYDDRGPPKGGHFQAPPPPPQKGYGHQSSYGKDHHKGSPYESKGKDLRGGKDFKDRDKGMDKGGYSKGGYGKPSHDKGGGKGSYGKSDHDKGKDGYKSYK